MERRDALRWVLEWPAAYRIAQNVLGAGRTRDCIVKEILSIKPGERVLDIGCGPADILDYLPLVDYVGIDYSESYIEAAKRRFGTKGVFIATDVKNLLEIKRDGFDLVFAIGLLHHLDDTSALTLLRDVRGCLKPGGRFVALDPLIETPQNPIARFLARMDRGAFVRTLDGYQALASPSFSNVRATAKRDLLRIPYSHSVLLAQAN